MHLKLQERLESAHKETKKWIEIVEWVVGRYKHTQKKKFVHSYIA